MGNKYIFRIEKLTKTKVQGRVQHALREVPCPDADPERKHLNTRAGAETYADFKEQLRNRLVGVRIFRDDSPPVLEVFISASPDFFKKGGNQKKMFQDSMKHLAKKFGKENILLATIHRDETSPHLSAFIVPLIPNPEIKEYEAEKAGLARSKKKRRKKAFTEYPPEMALSAKSYIGGRASLSNMQTEFWEAAGKGVGLDRGIEGSKARHVNVNDWKRAMAFLEDGMKLPEFVIPEMSALDRVMPGKWAEEVKAAYEKKFSEVKKAVKLLMADAMLKIEKNESTAKRLNALKKSLGEREAKIDSEIRERAEERGYKIAEAGLFSAREERNSMLADLAELEQRRAADAARASLPDPNAAVKSQLNGALSDRTILMRALAKTIKQTHTVEAMAMLAHDMGVPAGKGDIFDRLVKSGHAANFEVAVMQVAAHINIDVEGGGRNAVAVASELGYAFK